MTLRALIFLLAIAAFGTASAAEQERKLPPVDEAAGDVSWLRFKNVRNQDERTRGIVHFRKQWELDTPDTPVWRELTAALQLGGAFIRRDKRRELCAPYLLGRWPDDVGPVDHAVVIARDAAVQSEPSASSPALGTLSYDIVYVSDWEIDDKAAGTKQKWVKIRYGNRDGYVPEEQVRSPIEHAACFVKSGNGWRMTGFAPAGGE